MSHPATDLAKDMRERADADKLPPEHELRILADTFDEVAAGYWGDPQTQSVKQFMGAWARARRAWCAYTGEPLV